MSGRSWLHDLVEEDGIRLDKSGSEWKALCPFHKEKTPSLVLYDDSHFHCFGCGAHGDDVEWLVRYRKMDIKDTLKLRDEVQGRPDGSSTRGSAKKGRGTPKGDPKPTKSDPARQPKFRKELPTSAVARYDYLDADGKRKFVVLRFEKDDGSKFLAVYHRAKRGETIGWAAGNPMKKNRPLFRLKELMEGDPKKMVMVVEGEKCALAAANAGSKAIVVSWCNGTNGWKQTDWSPLYGREILLVADADSPGRKCMQAIGDMLHSQAKKIWAVMPEGETGYDIADEIEHGNAPAWIAKLTRAFKPSEAKKNDEDSPPARLPDDLGEMGDNRYYKILGNVGDSVLIKLWTNRLLALSRPSLTSVQQLVSIAPDPGWWGKMLHTDTLSRPAAVMAGAGLLKIADKQGQIDMSRIHERGAARNARGETVWHLGNRLLVNGVEHGLDYEDGNIYLAGPTIDVGDLKDGRIDDDTKWKLCESIMRYRWLAPNDGRLMLGWLVTALCGGMLEWRPHMWFLGPSDMGKSWFIKNVLLPIQATACSHVAAPTEASISRQMGSSSLPIVFEEAEPDRTWINAVIELCRISAGGEGMRTRAEAGGGYLASKPLFSACMASTKLPRLSAADNSRFVVIRLSPQGIKDWPKLEQELGMLLAPPSQIPAAIRRTIVLDADSIRENANGIAAQLRQDGVGSREAMIRGALSAGWQWWSGGDEILDSSAPRASSRHADAVECLLEIFGHRVRTASGLDVTVLEVALDELSKPLAASYGVAYDQEMGMLLATGHPAITKMLSRGRFGGADVRTLLSQLDGVVQTKHPRRFGIGMRLRALVFPKPLCERLGLELP